jgi:NADH dehydrogenase [ubiquinone] 1 alpha subcomplex assembly factor 5
MKEIQKKFYLTLLSIAGLEKAMNRGKSSETVEFMHHPAPPVSPPLLFDRDLLARRRSRPAFSPGAPDFLLDRAREEILFRLDAMPASRGRAPRQPPAPGLALDTALELGAHDGRLTEALRQRPYIGTAIAAESCPALLARLQTPKLLCDEEAPPFRDQSLDLVVSSLALHLVNDLPGALVQIRRALKPGGLFLAAVLGGSTLRELREVLTQAEIETLGGASPRIPPMADVRDLGALLQRAGFALPVADSDRFTVTYPSPMALMREARSIGGGNILIARRKTPLRRATLLRAAQIYEERFSTEDGRAAASFEIIFLTGQAPADASGLRHYVSHLQQK